VSPEIERFRWLSRSLEMAPGFLSWAIVIGPIWLSFSYPWMLPVFIVAFDLYWLGRVLWFSAAVLVVHGRMRGVLAEDWGARLATLERRPARREELLRQLLAIGARPQQALGISAFGAGEARRRARGELAALDAVDRLPEPPPPAVEFVQVALITIDGEPLETLRRSVAAVAQADWPSGRTLCAIVSRAGDARAAGHVAAVRAEFGDAFADVIPIVDSLEPGVVAGGRSALAFGGRHLHRLLVRDRGLSPDRVLVTALGADHRLHPQYFSYLAWRHLTDGEGAAHVYRPVLLHHNELWRVRAPRRLAAAVLSQLQMARSVTRDRAGAGPASATLALMHAVGYWATDALPGDERFSWKSYFAFGRRYRTVPLAIPVSGDARRGRSSLRAVASEYLQARRWARGAIDHPFVVDNAVRHAEIPLWSRLRRVVGLLGEHAAWAIAPFVILAGSTLPLLLDPRFADTALVRLLPAVALGMLGIAVASLAALIWVDYRIVPAPPPEWGFLRRGAAALAWMGLPLLGVLFSILPAHEFSGSGSAGRYPAEHRTEEA
jgi:hypothetical protein